MSAKAELSRDRRRLANAIRALSMDAVQKANSGHPGMPMGMADIAEVLWNDFLAHNPANPGWPNRDRFVLSNGHGSMLHYSLLHLSGYDLPMSQIEQFRQLHSMTPGHPEYGDTPGIETTTGPLGQGLANSVGMALAEKVLAARFNKPDVSIIDHYTYVFAGDGCLMEGISHEACSLAATLGLGKLIVFWDDNGISIDGDVKGWFTDDTPARFRAYGWHVVAGVDGHDPEQVNKAIVEARAEAARPSVICCKTVIGWGSPNKQGSASTHGAALGADEVALVRQTIGWEYPPFEIPADIYAAWDARERGAAAESAWRERLERYRADDPD
ncbi:MAG: thiamine pyrophosphate-dependent enzyme, partial [Arenicellales bacterium]